MLTTTEELTKGERLHIARRRLGLTQNQMSKRVKATVGSYRKWELGELTKDCPVVGVGKLKDYERCFLLRKRHGYSLGELALEMGTCRWWISQMEKGEAPIDRLIEYWGT